MKTLKGLTLVSFILASHTLFAQELRVQGSALILGGINSAFVGGGIGFESAMGKHFSASLDGMFGSQVRGRTIEVKPAVHFFPSKGQKGIYFGPALKFIALSERPFEAGLYAGEFYTIGFDLGVKSYISNHLVFTLNTSPHLDLGGGVAGISAQAGIGYRF